MLRTGKKFSKPELSRVVNGDKKLQSAPEKPSLFRLDHLLLEKYPSYNRATLQTYIELGYVAVNQKIVKKPSAKISKTDLVELSVPTKKAPPSLPIIFEDENVLVLDKPNGMLSMAKGAYCEEPTLEDYGLLVHRLDRDTSGVVILAKNPETKTMLQKQFQNRTVKKTYYAITEGIPKLEKALIDLPIARNLKIPTTFQIDPHGKPATTYYEVVEKTTHHALLKLQPATGRTHQLRVHLKHLGTPIKNDPVYNGKYKKSHTPHKQESIYNNIIPQETQKVNNKRLMLHASSLEITIPKGNRKIFHSPLPEEFKLSKL